MQELGTREIALNELHAHPDNVEVYGALEVDDDFIGTIVKTGLIHKPLVTPLPDGGYRIVSGHRRIEALRQLGHDYVTCEVRVYETPEELTFDLVTGNRARHKTLAMRIREILKLEELQQIACQHSGDAGSEAFDDSQLNFNWKAAEGLSQAELAEKLGETPEFYKAVICVFSDRYRDSYVKSLEDGGAKFTKKALSVFIKEWDAVRKDILKNGKGLSAAAKDLRDAKSKALGKAPKGEKPKKATKAAKVKIPVEADEINNTDNAANFLVEMLGEGWDGEGGVELSYLHMHFSRILVEYARFCAQ